MDVYMCACHAIALLCRGCVVALVSRPFGLSWRRVSSSENPGAGVSERIQLNGRVSHAPMWCPFLLCFRPGRRFGLQRMTPERAVRKKTEHITRRHASGEVRPFRVYGQPTRSLVHWHVHMSSLPEEENTGDTSETRTRDFRATRRARYHCATPAVVTVYVNMCTC